MRVLFEKSSDQRETVRVVFFEESLGVDLEAIYTTKQHFKVLLVEPLSVTRTDTRENVVISLTTRDQILDAILDKLEEEDMSPNF